MSKEQTTLAKAFGEYQKAMEGEFAAIEFQNASNEYQREVAAELEAAQEAINKAQAAVAKTTRKTGITRNRVTFNPLGYGKKSYHGHSLTSQAGEIDQAVVDFIKQNKVLPDFTAIANLLGLTEYRVRHHVTTLDMRDGRYTKLLLQS